MKNNLLLILLLLGSCTAELKQARHVGLAKKHASKAGLEFCKDTVIHDTTITERYIHDTTFKAIHDTTRYETERVIVEHHYDHHTNTIYQKVECKGDTLILDREVIVKEPVTIEVYPALDFIRSWWWVALLIAVAIGIIKLYKKLGL